MILFPSSLQDGIESSNNIHNIIHVVHAPSFVIKRIFLMLKKLNIYLTGRYDMLLGEKIIVFDDHI